MMEQSPDLTFTVYAHSQASTRMANLSPLLTPDQQERIHLTTTGASTFVSQGAYGEVDNYASEGDFVPMFNFNKYSQAKKGALGNVHFLPASSQNPIAEHRIAGSTYGSLIVDLGGDYKRAHAH